MTPFTPYITTTPPLYHDTRPPPISPQPFLTSNPPFLLPSITIFFHHHHHHLHPSPPPTLGHSPPFLSYISSAPCLYHHTFPLHSHSFLLYHGSFTRSLPLSPSVSLTLSPSVKSLSCCTKSLFYPVSSFTLSFLFLSSRHPLFAVFLSPSFPSFLLFLCLQSSSLTTYFPSINPSL